MEIGNLDPRKVADSVVLEVPLHHPAYKGRLLKLDDGSPLVWKIRGSDSTQWRNASVEVQRRNSQARREDPDLVRTVEDTDLDLLFVMAEATVEMAPITIDGETPKTPLDALKGARWIGEQLLRYTGDREKVFLAAGLD